MSGQPVRIGRTFHRTEYTPDGRAVQSYTLMLAGALRWAEANAVTTASTARSVVDGYVTNIPSISTSIAANPMWALTAEYE